MLGDIEPLKGILDDLASATSQPDILPDHAKDFVEVHPKYSFLAVVVI